MTINLPGLRARGPYDFDRSFRRIVCAVVASHHPEMGQRIQPLGNGEFPLALRVRDRPFLIGLRQDDSGTVQPRVLAGRADRSDQALLLAALRRTLCLDHDLDRFY